MPSYSFKCLACSARVMLTMPITEAPGIGTTLKVEDSAQYCPECNSDTFQRIWGKTSAPFRFNMRRTPV